MDAELLTDLYRQMTLCRRFEEAAARAYSQGKIKGFLHLYIGQEAVAVGALSGAAPTDSFCTLYLLRQHFYPAFIDLKVIALQGVVKQIPDGFDHGVGNGDME